MWLTTVYFLIFLSITCAKILVFTEDAEEKYLNSCVLKLLNVIRSENPVLDVTLIDSTDTLHKELNDDEHFPIISRSSHFTNKTVSNKVYVIYSKDTRELKDSIAYLKHGYHWNPKGTFIIYIQDTNFSLNHVPDLFKHENIFNVSVIIKINGTDDNRYNVYGFTSDIDTCHRPKQDSFKLLTTCSKCNSTNVFILRIPERMRDCHFKIYARDEWPYIRYPNNPQDFIGIDQYIFETWKIKKNISAELIFFNTKYDLDYFFDSPYYRNSVSSFDAFSGGYILRYIRTQLFDYSYPFLVDYSNIIVARSPFLGKWEVINKQFSYTVILLTSALFAIFCIIASTLSLFKSKVKDVIRDIVIVYGYFVNNTNINRLNSQFSARIILLNLFLFVFLLSNIIQAFLLSASTHPMRDFQITESHEILKKFQPVMYIPWMSKYNFTNAKNCSSIFACFAEVANGKNKFTVAPDSYYDLFSWVLLDEQDQIETLKIPETLVLLLRVTYFQRGSTLLEPYNDHLLSMMSGGLVNNHMKMLINQARLKSKVKDPPAYVPSTLQDFKEAFIVLVVGYTLSIFVFIYELKSKKKQ